MSLQGADAKRDGRVGTASQAFVQNGEVLVATGVRRPANNLKEERRDMVDGSATMLPLVAAAACTI